MDVGQMQQQLLDYTDSLIHEGFLDEQFLQLQKLNDDNNTDFVVEVVHLFFDDSEKLMSNMNRVLEQQIVDYKVIDSHVHQLKGSSSSIGAMRVKNICMGFRDYCEAQNRQGCHVYLQRLQYEYSHFKNKIQTLFRMEQQYLAAGGKIPIRD